MSVIIACVCAPLTLVVYDAPPNMSDTTPILPPAAPVPRFHRPTVWLWLPCRSVPPPCWWLPPAPVAPPPCQWTPCVSVMWLCVPPAAVAPAWLWLPALVAVRLIDGRLACTTWRNCTPRREEKI